MNRIYPHENSMNVSETKQGWVRGVLREGRGEDFEQLTFIIIIIMHKANFCFIKGLPFSTHLSPFFTYPDLHLQVYDPCWFSHSSPASQKSPSSHSFVSEMKIILWKF